MAKQIVPPTPATPITPPARPPATVEDDVRVIAARRALAQSERELAEAEQALAAERAKTARDNYTEDRAKMLGAATASEQQFTAAVVADQARKTRLELLPVAIKANIAGREVELRETLATVGAEIAAERLPGFKAALAALARAELAALDLQDAVIREYAALVKACGGRQHAGLPPDIQWAGCDTRVPRAFWERMLRWAESR